MISAIEALDLLGARITDEDVRQLKDVMLAIEHHIRNKMEFNGPPQLDISFQDMSRTVAKVVAHVMKPYRWAVNVNLMSAPPRVQGGDSIPHHWVLQFQPMPEVYDELLKDFEISPPTLLA